MDTVETDNIRIAGIEVDMNVRSHHIDPNVMNLIRQKTQVLTSKSAKARAIGVSRHCIDRILDGTCAPDTYICILKTLFPEKITSECN